LLDIMKFTGKSVIVLCGKVEFHEPHQGFLVKRITSARF